MARDVEASNHTNSLQEHTSMIYLYIKQHSITGLKYFGKTTNSNPFKYPGSGSYWSSHIKKHGKDFIRTIEIFGFDNQKLCTEFALKFSIDNNIIEEKINGKKTWANLTPENGLDGTIKGTKRSEQTKARISKSSKGRTWKVKDTSKISVSLIGKSRSDETKLKIGRGHKGKILSEETKRKLSEANKGYKHSDEAKVKMSKSSKGRKQIIVECPHCNKIGGISNLTRHHFDNCKFK